jgi:hypothetical protein
MGVDASVFRTTARIPTTSPIGLRETSESSARDSTPRLTAFADATDQGPSTAAATAGTHRGRYRKETRLMTTAAVAAAVARAIPAAVAAAARAAPAAS